MTTEQIEQEIRCLWKLVHQLDFTVSKIKDYLEKQASAEKKTLVTSLGPRPVE